MSQSVCVGRIVNLLHVPSELLSKAALFVSPPLVVITMAMMATINNTRVITTTTRIEKLSIDGEFCEVPFMNC